MNDEESLPLAGWESALAGWEAARFGRRECAANGRLTEWTVPRFPLPVAGCRGFSTYAPMRRDARYPSSSEIGTRSWAMVSRSRTVTASSSSESKSTVMQYGVPISS